MILGLEQVQFKSGMGAGKYFSATNIALSHSLLMDVLWATLIASAYLLTRHYPLEKALSAWCIDDLPRGSEPLATRFRESSA